MKKIYIIILNYNGKVDTVECLSSLKRLATGGWGLETIVVDNGSTDGSAKAIKKAFPQIRVIKTEKNLGFSGGNNAGISHVLKMPRSNLGKPDKAEYVLFLNNDTVVDKNLVEELVKIAETDEKIGIVSPKIYFAPGFEFHKDKYKKKDLGKVVWYAGGEIDWQNMYGKHRGVDEVDKGQFENQREIDFATGCCMLIKTGVFEKAGLFDERFFLYLEDLDLSLKVKKAGYKIVFAPKAKLWHKNSGSSGSGSELHDYYLTRNRLLAGWRYAPLRTKTALFKESLKKLLNARKWEKIGVRDFYLGRFGKGSRK